MAEYTQPSLEAAKIKHQRMRWPLKYNQQPHMHNEEDLLALKGANRKE